MNWLPAGLAAAEVLGLNRSPRLNLPGEGDGGWVRRRSGRGLGFLGCAMLRRRLRWRRRFGRSRRLRLRNTNAGKSDNSDESRDFGDHSRDGKKAGGITVNPNSETLERRACLRYPFPGMLDLTLGCLKWAAVGFVVAFALMKLFEASHIHDDIPKPAFKIRQTKRVTLVLSTFAAMLSALVWLLVQKLD